MPPRAFYRPPASAPAWRWNRHGCYAQRTYDARSSGGCVPALILRRWCAPRSPKRSWSTPCLGRQIRRLRGVDWGNGVDASARHPNQPGVCEKNLISTNYDDRFSQMKSHAPAQHRPCAAYRPVNKCGAELRCHSASPPGLAPPHLFRGRRNNHPVQLVLSRVDCALASPKDARDRCRNPTGRIRCRLRRGRPMIAIPRNGAI